MCVVIALVAEYYGRELQSQEQNRAAEQGTQELKSSNRLSSKPHVYVEVLSHDLFLFAVVAVVWAESNF